MAPHGDPIAELVLTVLSQSTNDRNRDVAYLRLRERFPTWEAVMRGAGRGGRGGDPAGRDLEGEVGADQGDPRGDRRATGGSRHAGSSSRGFTESPEQIGSSARPPSCRSTGCPRPRSSEARDYLTALPGVGRKTAACVLLFAYGLHDVPVDTHVSRVGMRLRLLQQGASFEQLHDQMLALTPPGEELELHVNLLRHGRRTCHARKPACGECALARMCPSRKEFA